MWAGEDDMGPSSDYIAIGMDNGHALLRYVDFASVYEKEVKGLANLFRKISEQTYWRHPTEIDL